MSSDPLVKRLFAIVLSVRRRGNADQNFVLQYIYLDSLLFIRLELFDSQMISCEYRWHSFRLSLAGAETVGAEQ